MCVPISDRTMLGWLRGQLRIVEAWQAELLRRGDADLETVTRLQTHFEWLTSEVGRLEEDKRKAA
ncbi:MAG: hypothetical protein AAGK23_07165 [Pseudomonadota bacterium]